MNPKLHHSLYCSPWNIDGAFWMSMHTAAQSPGGLSLADFVTPREPMEIVDGMARISVTGVLGNLAPIDELFGDTDYDNLANEIIMASHEADGIMFNIDSPGGMCAGNIEVARLIGQTGIPTAAHITGLGCSAAYAIAAGADYITAEPSATVGSIGTILPLLDMSGLWESAGVKPDYITSGDLKAAGYPPAQTPEERESLQQIVDDLFALFKGHVTAYRAVPASAMRGQAFIAERAKSMRLIDAVASAEQAEKKLRKKMKG